MAIVSLVANFWLGYLFISLTVTEAKFLKLFQANDRETENGDILGSQVRWTNKEFICVSQCDNHPKIDNKSATRKTQFTRASGRCKCDDVINSEDPRQPLKAVHTVAYVRSVFDFVVLNESNQSFGRNPIFCCFSSIVEPEASHR